MKRVNRQQAGEAEAFVALLLEKRGCRIVGRNYRIRGSEIDILACKGDTLFVVEVKYRQRPTKWAFQIESMLNYPKQLALRRGSEMFMRRFNEPIKTIRFDLAVVSCGRKKTFGIQYFPNVFEV